jgi:prepilin peptidase CpaA
MQTMTAQAWIAVLVGVAAMIDDLSRRQISNWIVGSALVAGFGWQMSQFGGMGLLYGIGGAIAGFAAFLIFYLLGGMGGGDVKLMAGFGALLGPSRLFEAALWIAGVGGLLAVAVLSYRAIRKRNAHDVAMPYAPAIALGVWLSMVPKS